MNFTYIKWHNQFLRCKYKLSNAFVVTSWAMEFENIADEKNTEPAASGC